MRGEFFFDSYALIALVRGDPAYEPFRGEPVACERFNLYEMAYAVLRTEGERAARTALRRVRAQLLEPRRGQLLRAAALRLAPDGRRFSYVDALGYVLAADNGLRFLTGDRAFRGLPNVEFVPVA